MNTSQQEVEVVAEAAAPEVPLITDVDHFANIITAWHAQQVATMQHLMDVPVDTEVVIGDEGESIVLSGDVHKAFKLGVDLSLDYFRTLPFTSVETDAEVSTT